MKIFEIDTPPLPQIVLDKFWELGDMQRGRPEMAMLNVQSAMGGGILSVVVEHTGDLIHRITHAAKYGMFCQDIVQDKCTKILRLLQHPYGFKRELEENIRSNAKYKNIPYDIFKKRIVDALTVYANEHSKLPAYNKLQWLCRDASIAVGEQRWDDATDSLAIILEMANSNNYEKIASEYTLTAPGDDLVLYTE